MAGGEVTRLLNLIGNILGNDPEYPHEGTLLYAEVADGFVGCAVFKDLGTHILYRSNIGELMRPLLDLWGSEPPDRRWNEIEYILRDDEFQVRFVYSEEIDPDEEFDDRCVRVVKKLFGDKPIVYPSLSTDEQIFEMQRRSEQE